MSIGPLASSMNSKQMRRVRPRSHRRDVQFWPFAMMLVAREEKMIRKVETAREWAQLGFVSGLAG